MKNKIMKSFVASLCSISLILLLSGCVPYGPSYYTAPAYYNNSGYNNGYYNGGSYYSGSAYTPGYNYYAPSNYGTGWAVSPSVGVGVGF